MAALKGVVSKIEDVEEKYRDLYTKTEDGRFIVQVEGVDDLPAVVGLKSKRDELLGKLKEVTSKFDGIDADEARSLKSEIEKLKKGGGNDAGKVAELEARVKQLTETSANEVKAAKEAAEKESTAAKRYFMRSEINRVLGEAGGSPDLLGRMIEEQVKVERVGDDYKLVVVDSAGHARIKNAANEPLTVADLVPGLQAKYPGAFPPKVGSGAGTKQGGEQGGNGGAPTTIKRNDPNIGKYVKEIASGKIKVVNPE